MPRPSSIKKDLVFDVAYTLMSQGVHPAVSAVQSVIKERTGSAGSTKVVSAFLAQWRDEVATGRPRTPDLGFSQQINERIASLSLALLDEATQAALQRLKSDAAEIRAKYDRAAAECATARNEADDARRAVSNAESERVAAEARIAELKAQIVAMAAKAEATQHALDQQVEENSRIKQTTQDLQKQMQNLLHQQAEELAKVMAESDKRLNEQRQKFEADIARERDVWLGERTYLHRQTDELRQATKERMDGLQKQLEGANEMVTQFRMRALQLEEQVSKWQRIAEQAQDTVATMQKASPAAQRP
jgi:chromosome segregation ATPase